jgi:hypothetical protein
VAHSLTKLTEGFTQDRFNQAEDLEMKQIIEEDEDLPYWKKNHPKFGNPRGHSDY